MLKKLFFLLNVQGFLVLAVTLYPNSVYACSCLSQTVEEAISNSDAIFEGRVIEIGKGTDDNSVSTRTKTVRLRVVRSWKGVEEEELTVITATDEAGCGYSFRANQSYLVYANSIVAGLRVGLCSRTKPIDEAEDDLDTLGMGVVPVSARLPQDEKRVLQSTKPPTERAGCASCGVVANDGVGKGALVFWLTLWVVCLVHKRCEHRRSA